MFDIARPTKWVLLIGIIFGVTSIFAETPCENPQYKHGHSYVHPLKYDVDFKHFEYANPNAPRGGILRMAQLGTFDNFNNMIDKGRLLAGYDLGGPGALIYDSFDDQSVR